MDKRLSEPFSASLVRMVFAMTKLQCTSFGETNYSVRPIASLGVASLIHLTGKISGRIMLDVESEVAIALTEKITGTRYASAREEAVLLTLAEINNIVTGDAVTALNNEFSLALRSSPPIVFAGENAAIALPKIETATMLFTSLPGNLQLSVAFRGGLTS